MSYVEQETTINVPVEKVFQALLEIERAPQWMANLEEVRNITGRNLNDTFEWTFKMVGMSFKGKTTFTALVPNQHLREEGSGDLTSAWDWKLTPVADGATHMRVGIEYTVPGGGIGAIANKLFIERQNEKDLQTSLSRLKALLEK